MSDVGTLAEATRGSQLPLRPANVTQIQKFPRSRLEDQGSYYSFYGGSTDL